MLPYLIFFILLSLVMLLYSSKKISKKTVFITTFLIIAIFGAIRYQVGWDYVVYERILTTLQNTDVLLYERNEILSNLLYYLSAHTNIYIFFIISSVLMYYLILKTAYKYSKHYFVSIFLFISFPLFYLNSFSVIRNFLAIAICFYAVKFILEKKLLKYILAILIASMFHNTALIMMLGIILIYIKITPFISIIIMFAIILMRDFWIYMLSVLDIGHYDLYLSTNQSQDGQTAFIVLLIIYIYVILSYFNRKIISNQFNIYFFMFSIGIGLFVAFWGAGTLSHRLSLYFLIYSILVVPYYIEDIYKTAYFYIATSLLFLYMIYFYYLHPNDAYVPYSTLFQFLFNK